MLRSLPARGAWIEIPRCGGCAVQVQASLPARKALLQYLEANKKTSPHAHAWGLDLKRRLFIALFYAAALKIIALLVSLAH